MAIAHAVTSYGKNMIAQALTVPHMANECMKTIAQALISYL